MVRYRAKLVQLRSGLKAQVHAVMAKQGVLPNKLDMFSEAGIRQLDQMELGRNYAIRVQSLRELIGVYDREITVLERDTISTSATIAATGRCRPSTGPDQRSARSWSRRSVTFTGSPRLEHLCSWAGLTPKHHESDLKTRRGRISKQGSRLLRWALIEAISRYHGGPILAGQYRNVAKRRGTNKARVAIARKVLTLAYYGLRDGEIRCLAQPKAA